MVPSHAFAYQPSCAQDSGDVRERREAERISITFKLSVSLDDNTGENRVLVFPTSVKDISRLGVRLESRIALPEGQRVILVMPTTQCPVGMHMPEAFIGPSTIVRAEETVDGKCDMGVRFSEAFTQNIDFLMFVDFLHSTALSEWLLQQ